ncbi:MAG: DUF3465 domain-containing protein [Candidatus Eremiobacteraeota bacterium]|nr:DUF3465 domain-containing protein [Candidatus Eremiobacteraeota bacterium]
MTPIAACGPSDVFGSYDDASARAASAQHRTADVEVSGMVTADPTFFFGRRTRAWHEEFPLVTQHGLHLDVIDNVDLAPRIPLHAGDTVAVKGQLIPTGNGAIVHDTHHCTGPGWHSGGWIEWHGRRYQ